jgi:TolB-like protein
MAFFEELKRRHVIRMAILYIVVGWALVEVADFSADTFGAPDWVVQMFTVLVLLGFPLVLIGAWAFEMTPDGLKRDTGAVETEDSEDAENSATVAESFDTPPAVDAPSENSIAVLPFVNMSSDQEQEYFSDGLSEELLNLLAHIPELRVAARTSSFSFKGKDVEIPVIAEKLKVANVLEGSVRKAGNQVRITAQLIKADDGYHLWSETFDKTLDDIFAIQDEIASDVVAALKITLLGEVPTVRETSPEAYALYLQARHLYESFDHAKLERSRALFEQALAIDPGYAPAWDGLAGAYHGLVIDGRLDAEQGVPLARASAERALALDDSLAEAHAGMALIKMVFDWDWAGAKVSLDRALELAPGSARVHQRAAHLAADQGRLDEALAFLKHAILLSPLDVGLHRLLALYLTSLHKYDEARASLRRIIDLSPRVSVAHNLLGLILLLQDQPEAALAEMKLETDEFWQLFGMALVMHALSRQDEADAALQRLIEENAKDAPYQIAEVYAYRGEIERAFEWLDRAYDERDSGLPGILTSVFFPGLHSDPRWEAFVHKLGLPWPLP